MLVVCVLVICRNCYYFHVCRSPFADELKLVYREFSSPQNVRYTGIKSGSYKNFAILCVLTLWLHFITKVIL